ncbi:VanZ family protein [Lacinutrix undariae]
MPNKQLALVALLSFVAALTVLSLISITSMPEIGTNNDDKIYHATAYFIFTILTYNYFYSIKIKYKMLLSFCIPVIYGIIIEFLQSVVSSTRISDFYDAVANFIGVVIALILIKFIVNLKLNKNNHLHF